MPIGVFDSGLGGLTVLRALRAAIPEQAFLYLGDTAHAPYGTKSEPEIHDLTRRGVAVLFERGCRLVILACNTASAVALRRLQETWVPPDRRVLGVFVPQIEEIAGRSWSDPAPASRAVYDRVLFFATPATVASGAFERELHLRVEPVRVVSVPCPGLVDALEAGDRALAGSLVERFVAEGLSSMPDPQAALLGCTHYPLLRQEFVAALPPETRILDQPARVAASLADYLRRHPEFAGQGETAYLTTGAPEAVARAAERLLGEAQPFVALRLQPARGSLT